MTAAEEVAVLRRAAEGGAFEEAAKTWFDSGLDEDTSSIEPTAVEIRGCRQIIDRAAVLLDRPPLDPAAVFDAVVDVMHFKITDEAFEDYAGFWANFVPRLVARALELSPEALR